MRQARGLVISMLAPVAVLAVLAACSSSSSSSSSAFVQQYCSLLRPCCQTTSGGGDGSGCVDFYTFFGGNVDSATGDACLAEIHAHQTDMAFCSKVSVLTPSCQKAFSRTTGSNPPGASCQTSADCAPSPEGKVSCSFVTTGAPGSTTTTSTCQLVIDGKVGDTPCIGTRTGAVTNFSNNGAQPPRGFVCDVANQVWCNPKSSACEATLKIGDPCTFADGQACGADASCGSDDKCVANPPSSDPPAMDSSLFIVCSKKN